MKRRPNHARYLEILRRLTPEERLAKAFELSEFSIAVFRAGLQQRHPELGPRELAALLRARLDKCHNRNS